MTAQPDEFLRAVIVRVLTTHSIVEVEQGRSFPLSASEAAYAATCLLADDAFLSCTNGGVGG